MNQRGNDSPCRMIGVSVTGAKHARQGQPGQDALARRSESGEGLPVCLAVADGHGSAASFRSGVGSRLAVESAAPHRQPAVVGFRGAGGGGKPASDKPEPLGLKNLTSRRWVARLASGETREIEPGRSIALADGTEIDFGTAKGTIRR